MRAPAAAAGLAALCACLEAPPRGVDPGGGDAGVSGDGPTGDAYRREITIVASTVIADLADFPVLVRLVDDDALGLHATMEGDDLSFADDQGDPLAFEIEHWDGADLRAWVRLPMLPADEGTTFYLRYGPGAPRVGEPGAVWDDDFAVVWHLEEEPGAVADATASGIDAVGAAGETTSDTGYLGNGLLFDGAGDYVDFGADQQGALDVGSALTVTAWVRYDVKTAWAHFFGKASSNTQGWAIGIDFDDDFLVRVMNGSDFSRGWNAAASPELETWYHWAMVYDGGAGTDATRLGGYRDGAALALTFDDPIPSSFDTGAGDLVLGCASWRRTDYCIEGMVDEVHVSTVARSGVWIDAEYRNQQVDSDFLTIGPEEKL